MSPNFKTRKLLWSVINYHLHFEKHMLIPSGCKSIFCYKMEILNHKIHIRFALGSDSQGYLTDVTNGTRVKSPD